MKCNKHNKYYILPCNIVSAILITYIRNVFSPCVINIKINSNCRITNNENLCRPYSKLKHSFIFLFPMVMIAFVVIHFKFCNTTGNMFVGATYGVRIWIGHVWSVSSQFVSVKGHRLATLVNVTSSSHAALRIPTRAPPHPTRYPPAKSLLTLTKCDIPDTLT
jgi:hypothetical protein